MNNQTKIILFSLFLAFAQSAWAQGGAGWTMQRGLGPGACKILIASIPQKALDASEAAQLFYLREEEKLARDVYIRLHSKWAAPIWQNISRSEERHFDALKLLLDRHRLRDPAAGKAMGSFQDAGLQTLYGDLVAQGEASFSAALRTGATIEDLSVRNLEKALASTDNSALKMVYRNLQNASRNHLSVLANRLEAAGEKYAAQYISPEALEAILSDSNDAGMNFAGRRNGPKGMGRRYGMCPWAQTR